MKSLTPLAQILVILVSLALLFVLAVTFFHGMPQDPFVCIRADADNGVWIFMFTPGESAGSGRFSFRAYGKKYTEFYSYHDLIPNESYTIKYTFIDKELVNTSASSPNLTVTGR